MVSFEYEITDEMGMHARPSGLLVKTAKQFSSAITVECNGKSADATRLIALMAMGVKVGHKITIKADGEDEEMALASIKECLKNYL